MNDKPFSIKDLLALRAGEEHELHEHYVNPQMRRVLKTIGFDKDYVRGEGPYLYDGQGNRYLDFLSGYGVFNMGRSHPEIKRALHEAIDLNLPSLVQMDDHLLSGLLAEKLIQKIGGRMAKVFFCNSGSEAVEGAIKLCRGAAKKSGFVYCDHGFHGLTMGCLSVNGGENFREGFGPFLPNCRQVPFNDLAALEREFRSGDVAAFIVEPIQGKGVHLPSDDYFPGVRRLCDRYGVYLVCDEVQVGMGRTGRLFAHQHWNIEPDMLLISKSLSGGMVPVGAIAMSEEIHRGVFSSMERSVAHGSTFGESSLAMVCGLAALEVLERERLVENAAVMGNYLMEQMRAQIGGLEMVKEIRGKGLILGIEFQRPRSLTLRLGWEMLHKASGGLFPQIMIVPLMERYRILTQVAGHNLDVIKLLPTLNITRQDADYYLEAFQTVVKEAHQFPGAVWELGKNLTANFLRR